MKDKERAISTRCVQGTEQPSVGPVVKPIVQTSTFIFESQKALLASMSGKSESHLYTRYSNPTTREVELKISSLEGADDSIALASGMAAISSALLSLVKTGDKILSIDSIYGGTFHFFEKLIHEMNIEVDFVDCDRFADSIEEIGDKYKVCYFETPTNPTLKVVDIRKVSDASKSAGLTSVIDNTFATPINQRPHEMGIDIVINSATKYMGGHSDLVAGVVSSNTERMARIRSTAKLLGGSMDPFAAFLLDRGLKTLAIRMDRHNSNAMAIAERLTYDSRILKVRYPGLPSHPQYDISSKQMSGFGGIVSIDLDCSAEETVSFVESLNLFLNAVSLGGVESLVSIPVMTSQYGIDAETLKEMGISPSTVRLSVGIEDVEDLHADIIGALDSAL